MRHLYYRTPQLFKLLPHHLNRGSRATNLIPGRPSPGSSRLTPIPNSRGRLGSPVNRLTGCGPILSHLVGWHGSRRWNNWATTSDIDHSLKICCWTLLISSPLFLGRRRGEILLFACDNLGFFCRFLPLHLFRVTVEEQVGHHLPRGVPGDGPPQPQHLPGQHPPHEADAVGALVVAGHGDVDELGWRVNVAQSHDGDVGVGGFSHRLVVSPGVADKKQSWLPESCLDLVGEGSRGETASNGGATNVSGELEDSPLSLRPACDNINVHRVLHRGDGTRSKQKLLPGFLEVDDVHSISLLLPDVLLHGGLTVVGANVRGGGQHLGHVLLGQGEGRYAGGHFRLS